MAIVHALGLLCAHALYWLRMHGENRQHSIRTGPAGTVIGTGHQIHTTVFWAITQVCQNRPPKLCYPSACLTAAHLQICQLRKTAGACCIRANLVNCALTLPLLVI